MIDIRTDNSDIEAYFPPVLVRSPTGKLIGVFWGTCVDICDAIDEVTDPNDCTYRQCGPGGVRLGCFSGEEEISVQDFRKVLESDEVDRDVRFEGISDRLLDCLDSHTEEWQPIVPLGFTYIAGLGFTKIDSEWN